MQITIVRYGHRIIRDARVTTHCALVARALGAQKMILIGEEDLNFLNQINKINEEWGGTFKIEFNKTWKESFSKLKKENTTIIHNTMYGIPIQKKVEELRKKEKIAIVIGSKRVPKEIYFQSDYNIAITNQPHSEIASLAITLHELFQGKELEQNFSNSKKKIIPKEKGKKIVKTSIKKGNSR